MWKWVRIPKGIALLAFLLPWMTVSCSGQPLASASGFGLAIGSFSSSAPQGMAGGPSGGQISIWLIMAILVIALGLIVSLSKDKKHARIVVGTSAAAVVLIWIGTSRYSKSAILAEAARKGGDQSIDQAAAAMIRIDWHFGFWLAIVALLVAGIMAWLAHSGREALVEERVRDALAGAATPAPGPEAAVPPEPAGPQIDCPTCGRSYAAGTRFCPDDGTALT